MAVRHQAWVEGVVLERQGVVEEVAQRRQLTPRACRDDRNQAQVARQQWAVEVVEEEVCSAVVAAEAEVEEAGC